MILGAIFFKIVLARPTGSFLVITVYDMKWIFKSYHSSSDWVAAQNVLTLDLIGILKRQSCWSFIEIHAEWEWHTVFRDRGGGGAGRAIALPLFCWLIYFLGLQLTWKTFSWNYWTFPLKVDGESQLFSTNSWELCSSYGRVGCLLVRTITTRCACKDNRK